MPRATKELWEELNELRRLSVSPASAAVFLAEVNRFLAAADDAGKAGRAPWVVPGRRRPSAGLPW